MSDDELAALTAAVCAVLALHQPLNDLGSPPCASCLGDDDGEPVLIPWPCPTVCAIAAHLDLTRTRDTFTRTGEH